ncbi:MAG: TfoX-like protein [Ramlibacter sp.]|nr:TfoX-like protein [Ramlibacter sp.]
MAADPRFVDYCCELLSSVGPCRARRMFGGWGIDTVGLTIAIVADMGTGQKLWLKGDETTRAGYEEAGCVRFTYLMQGVERGMNYFSAPEDALESPQLMAPWARQALDCALKAQSARRSRPSAKSQAKPTTLAPNRAKAPAAKPKASRKSARG